MMRKREAHSPTYLISLRSAKEKRARFQDRRWEKSGQREQGNNSKVFSSEVVIVLLIMASD